MKQLRGINWRNLGRELVSLLTIASFCLSLPGAAFAATPVSDSTLLFQISGSGPANQRVTVRFSTGPTQTVTIPSNGSFLLEALPVGQPEEITGTISFTTNNRATTLNLAWNRFDQTMTLSGTSTPYARIAISGSVSGSFSANGSGTFLSGDSDSPELEIDAGDFLGAARSIQLRITPTRYRNSREGWIPTDSITVGMATNLPANPEQYTPSSPTAEESGGGSGGDGDDIGQQLGSAVVAGLVSAGMNILQDLFSTENLMAGLGEKIEDTWIDVWRSMSQQETSSDQQMKTAEASETDAEVANDAANETSEDQAETTEELAGSEALCQMTGTARLAEAEAEREATDEALAEEVESTADIDPASEDAQGRSARYCRYARDVPNPEFQAQCEEAGHEVNAESGVTDQAVAGDRQSDVQIDGDERSDTAESSIANLQLVTAEHNSLSGVGAAARDPGQFQAVMDARSVTATENLIKASLTRTVALRAQGTGTNTTQLRAIMEALGYPADYITRTLGQNPSYYSQLEIGTKLAYQDQNFYVNLEGMNETQLRAIQAGLDAQSSAQWREIYYSVRQRELMLATILEAKLRAAQPRITAQLSGNSGAR
jgi:hypothetical protein